MVVSEQPIQTNLNWGCKFWGEKCIGVVVGVFNCGKIEFGLGCSFQTKMYCSCGCGVQFPKIVVGVGVVVDKI